MPKSGLSNYKYYLDLFNNLDNNEKLIVGFYPESSIDYLLISFINNSPVGLYW